MKTLLIIGFLLAGISEQAMAMGHPHNMFAARKQLRTKALTSVVKPKSSASSNWQPTVQLTKTAFGERLLMALSQLHPARPY